MRIGELRDTLLKELGSAPTEELLRRYESLGLWKASRTKGNFRYYPPEVYNRVKEVIKMVKLGIPLQILVKNDQVEIKKRINIAINLAKELKK